MSVSVVILTYNEAINLSDCLDSVAWCDDVVIYDSFSTDQTVEIAKAAGARVYQNEFVNYAKQRNAALNDVEYRHDWVIMLDADERVTDEATAEILERVRNAPEGTSMFRMRRKDMFMGCWIRRSSAYPTWFARVMRLGHVVVEREINEEYQTTGSVDLLNAHLMHYPFNKGIDYWFERHNRYSTMEARVLIKEQNVTRLSFKGIVSRDPVVRRKSLKQLAYRLPFRPFIVFLYLYVFRRGILDGQAGFIYAVLRAFYELMIELKIREARRRAQQLPL